MPYAIWKRFAAAAVVAAVAMLLAVCGLAFVEEEIRLGHSPAVTGGCETINTAP